MYCRPSLSTSRRHEGNCQGKCRRILRKSIITSAKKLPTLILYGTQMLYFNPLTFRLEQLSLVENIAEHIYFQDHRQEINALKQSCIIYLYFFFLADLNSLDTTFVGRKCYLFLLIKTYFQHKNGETKFIH